MCIRDRRLAEEMGLNIRSIRDWESGATKPALSTIIKLCSLLDVSSDYLLGIDNRDPLYLDDFSENDQILIRAVLPVSYTHLDVYKRQVMVCA